MERKELIRTIYLYLFSLVGLVLVVIGLVQLVDLGLKSYVFTKADETVIYPMMAPVPTKPGSTDVTQTPEEIATYQAQQEEAQRKQTESGRERTASNSLALLIIGAPLFLYHWKIVQKDKQTR